jgi:hypothetical protein
LTELLGCPVQGLIRDTSSLGNSSRDTGGFIPLTPRPHIHTKAVKPV